MSQTWEIQKCIGLLLSYASLSFLLNLMLLVYFPVLCVFSCLQADALPHMQKSCMLSRTMWATKLSERELVVISVPADKWVVPDLCEWLLLVTFDVLLPSFGLPPSLPSINWFWNWLTYQSVIDITNSFWGWGGVPFPPPGNQLTIVNSIR